MSTVSPRTAAEVRELYRRAIEDFGIPGILLMENAGAGASRSIQARYPEPGRALIWCGKGNNGGDGFVIGRHLHNQGWRVQLFTAFALEGSRMTGDAALNLGIAERMGLDIIDLPGEALARFVETAGGDDLVVDALLGTGLAGEVRAPYGDIIEAINAAPGPVLAVDIPSGLNGDTGEILGVAVEATWTVTFAAPKIGLSSGSGPQHTGPVEVIEISIPRQCFREL